MRARPYRIAVALLGLVLLTISCSDRGDGPTAPARGAPADVISDGAHGGNPHFFFLQPMVPKPNPTGVADPDASPTVVVCRWEGTACGEIVAFFNADAGTGSETIRYDAASGSYIVNWHTDECVTGPCALDNGVPYRLRVLIGTAALGHADVMLGSNGAALRNVDTEEYIPLVNGRTLPVKFRIEEGAVQVSDVGQPAMVGADGGEVVSADGEVALTFPAGALATTTPIAVAPVTEELPGVGAWAAAVQLGPDGSTFAEPVILTMAYDASQFPEGLVSAALAIATWVDDHWEFVEGSVVDPTNGTVSAPIEHFSQYAIVIQPNFATTPGTVPEMTVGDVRTFTGTVWEWRTVPAQYCEWVRVRYGFNRYRYEWRCWTINETRRFPASYVQVRWSTSTPGIVSVGPPTSTFTDVNGATISPPVTATGTGIGVVSATAGWTTGSFGFNVIGRLNFDMVTFGSVRDVLLGIGQGIIMSVGIPAPRATPVEVALSHTTSVIANTPSITILAGSTVKTVSLGGLLTVGVDTVIGTAAGYAPDTVIVTADSGRLFVEGWPATLAIGDSAVLRIRPLTPDSTRNPNAWNTAFALDGGDALRFTSGGATITSIAIPSGSSRSPFFYVKAIAAGPATATFTNPNYVTGPYATEVIGPPVSTITVDPTPVGVRPGQTVQLAATARDEASQPIADVPFTWSTSDPARATVDEHGLVTGIANGVVTITATSGEVSGTATVHVGTPSIAPTPTSITIQVQQGQTNTGTITINNGGTGLLTGLQAGGFSDYYSGGAYSWMTASFNTTTAPAVLTISASPPANYPAGSYKMRFDVWAPGVNAFTFYSINVTIVPAGVTPVDATIAPNPTSLAFSVEQGQVVSRTIHISNSGTEPLTNLSVGTFSNYYNGSPAPWVTATVSPTTAPATITITAAPTDLVIAESHKLRFDVMSPGATNSPYTFFSIDVTVLPRSDPPFVATGGKSSCALRSDGSVLCWGEASFGATSPPAGTTFRTIGGGFFHYCGIRTDQTLRCWGYESDGRTIPPAGTFDRISVAPEHACAIRPDDTVACWGFGGDGRASVPVGTYRQIGNGWYHGCGVRTDQTVVCWGQNGAGQATPLSGTFKSVSGGAFFTCGIRTDDTIACWGSSAPPPTGTFTAIASSTSGGHACGIRTDETLACWGQNDSGQANPPAGQFLQVSTNNAQSCAVRKDRVVLCWGFGGTGATSVPAELQTP